MLTLPANAPRLRATTLFSLYVFVALVMLNTVPYEAGYRSGTGETSYGWPWSYYRIELTDEWRDHRFTFPPPMSKTTPHIDRRVVLADLLACAALCAALIGWRTLGWRANADDARRRWGLRDLFIVMIGTALFCTVAAREGDHTRWVLLVATWPCFVGAAALGFWWCGWRGPAGVASSTDDAPSPTSETAIDD